MSTLAPVLGRQEPRVLWVPPDGISSAAEEALDLCDLVGLDLDDWQRLVLVESLAERRRRRASERARWAAYEVGLMVSRQNGKGGALEGRELAALFLISTDELTIHSAHQFDTSMEAFDRLMGHIEATPELEREVMKVSRSHGSEGITVRVGGKRKRIRFRTRTKGGARGFSADLVILDEAMILPTDFHGALMPVVSARPNAQIWYTGSAVDQVVHEHGLVFAKVRARGITGGDPRLLYAEWSVDRREEGDEKPYTPDRVPLEVALDPEAWAEANPALGIRITTDTIEVEQRSMAHRNFCVERLGIGDWPDPEDNGTSPIDVEKWRGLADPHSIIGDPVALAFDIPPDRSRGWIAAAGQGTDGRVHLEVIETRSGVAWVPDRIRELVERHSPSGVVCDAAGPASSLVPAIEDLGVEVTVTTAPELVRACGNLFDLVEEGRAVHLGTPELEAAVKGAGKRKLGDGWAFSRTSSTVDIAPLIAVTLAAWKRSPTFFLF